MQVEFFLFHRCLENIYSIKLQHEKQEVEEKDDVKENASNRKCKSGFLHWRFKDEIRIFLLAATA
jgi:hypothetical protein